LKIVEPHFEFKILDTLESSHVYKLVPSGKITLLVKKYRKLFYNKRDYKIVPACILNSPIEIRRAYFAGFYAGDGYKKESGTVTLCQKGKINIQGIYYLAKSIGHENVSVGIRNDKPDIYKISIPKSFRKNPNKIKKMFEVDNIINKNYEERKIIEKNIEDDMEHLNIEDDMEHLNIEDEYVYDIETEAGTFLAGVGNMIVFNTDSLYLAMPEKAFKKIDIDYYTEKLSKLEYWEQLIKITFQEITPLNVAVNKMLEDNNGTKFLKMAYEESLFPCAFLAKKKYFGIPHISFPNFGENVKLFIRGLELKKRGVSDVLIQVCQDILNQSVSSSNILTIIEIVEKKIVEFYNTDWTTPERFAAFIMQGTYKPNKQNVKMHTFHDRMLAERNLEIAPGERVKFVMTKKYPYKYDMRGRKTELSVGDKMEFAEKAQEENIPIDIDYYMEKTINGQLARFITYHEDFQVPVIDHDDQVEVKKAEDTNLKLARKYVDNYCKQYYTNYQDKGSIYKSIFRKSAEIVKNGIMSSCGNDTIITKLLGLSVDPDDDLSTWIMEKAYIFVQKKPKNIDYGKTYIDAKLTKSALEKTGLTKSEEIIKLQKVYYVGNNSISKISEGQYNERQQILELRFRQSINSIVASYSINNNIIEIVADKIKESIDINSKYNKSTDDKIEEVNIDWILENNGIDIRKFDKSLNEISETNFNLKSEKLLKGIADLKFIYYNLVSNYEFIYQIRSIVDYLKLLRNKKIGIIEPTKKENKLIIDTFIKDSVDEAMKEFMTGF